jgi:branched-subunit amino acid aminotransferase/4-amino-4-deoxychorismate lyase
VQPLAVADLLAADEIFATSSLRGVVPVTRLGTHERTVGPVTTKIIAAYETWLRATG